VVRNNLMTHLTVDEVKEAKHLCIDRGIHLADWLTEIVRNELKKEHDKNNGGTN
jgi:hypothetical protein